MPKLFFQNLPEVPIADPKKVLVVSVHTNDTDFLRLQISSLRKFMKVPYEFVVGLDEPELLIQNLGRTDIGRSIREVARDFGLSLVDVPKNLHENRNLLFRKSDINKRFDRNSSAIRCADSLQYLLGVLPWQKFKAVLVLDADMFPIADVTMIPVSRLVPFHGVHQFRSNGRERVDYLWNGIFWLSGDAPFSNLFNLDFISRKWRNLHTDVGGQTKLWLDILEAHGAKGTFMQHLASGDWSEKDLSSGLGGGVIEWLRADYRNEMGGNFHAELYDGKYLHYRGGSNWMNRDPQQEIANRSRLVLALESEL